MIVEGTFAYAEPSGPTVHATFLRLRDRMLAEIEAAMPCDVVLLLLHGAMVSTGCDDCEGDLVASIRSLVGPAVRIGIELDPHCHLTDAMVRNCDAVILMKQYPHDDYVARAEELYDLCVRAAAGEIEPVMEMFDCRMVGFYPTTREPMQGIVDSLHHAEKEAGILSVSFAHGFPWGDTPDTGSRLLVVADGDRALARRVAKRIGLEIYSRRAELLPVMASVDEAVAIAAASNGLVTLADTADNPGGGAPGDNPFLLRAMLEAGVSDAALGCFWDPIVAATCADAGVGAELRVRLGGKMGPASGEPLDIACTVRAVEADHWQTGLGGSRNALGLSVWLSVEKMDIVVCSERTQTFSPDAFTRLGLDLATRRAVVVKSSQHFETGFRVIADRIQSVATPGAIQMDFASISYRKKRDLNFFPRAPDPLGEAG
jgi:microcystin degradation protein MlrC